MTAKCSMILGLYSLSGKTSYRKISWSFEAARFGFKLFQSLWNLAGTSAALLPMCLSNFRAIRPLQHPISWLRGFTRFGGKTSYRLVNRGPGHTSIPSSWRVYKFTTWQIPNDLFEYVHLRLVYLHDTNKAHIVLLIVDNGNNEFWRYIPVHVYIYIQIYDEIKNLKIPSKTMFILQVAVDQYGLMILQPGTAWWRHQMETLAVRVGNSPVTGECPSQRPVTRSFDVFFDLHRNKQFSKQSKRRWFETPSRSLWRHCHGFDMLCHYDKCLCYNIGSLNVYQFQNHLINVLVSS